MGQVEKKYVLGIDVGTQGVKTGLFDFEGKKLGFAFVPFEIKENEVFPQIWWKNVGESLKRCLEEAKKKIASFWDEEIAALGICATSCSLVVCDDKGNPLLPAIMWHDQRAEKEAKRITESKADFLRCVGGSEPAEYFWPKILWVESHRPEIYERTYYFVDAADWLIFKFTGNWNFSYPNAVVKSHYQKEGSFPEIFQSYFKKLPLRIVCQGELAGYLLPLLSYEFNLPFNLPVTTAGIDGYAAMIGLGLKEGEIGLSMETSWSQFLISKEKKSVRDVWGPFYGAILPDKYVYETGQVVAGNLVEEFFRKFEIKDVKKLEDDAEKFSGFPILKLAWGNRQPTSFDFNELAKFHPEKSLSEIFKMILEEVALGCAINLENLKKASETPPKKIIACGGGIKSELWCKTAAQRCKMPLQKSSEPESALLGAAICAVCAGGIFSSLEKGQKNMVKRKR